MFLIKTSVISSQKGRFDNFGPPDDVGIDVGRRAMVMKVQGRRKRGRPKRRWLDKVKDDIKEKGLSADDVYDRATWRPVA